MFFENWSEKLFWSFYSWNYDVLLELIPYQELLREIIDGLDLKQGQRILDAGCGTGNLELLLTKFPRLDNLKIEAVDFSFSMLKRARKKCSGKMVNFSYCDLNKTLPFKDNCFDRIVCCNVLYALRNPEMILREFHRILKFGGRLTLVTVVGKPSLWAAFKEHLSKGFTRKIWLKKILFFFRLLAVIPKLSLVIVLNSLILSKGNLGGYHFFSENSLEKILTKRQFRIIEKKKIYANTDLCFICSKALRKKVRSGEIIEISQANGREDLEEIFKLRYEVYCEEMKSLDPVHYPERKEYDFYDNYSVHFLARFRDVVVGTLRLIKKSPRGFLIEEKFPLPATIDRSRALEASRNIVKLGWRGRKISFLINEVAFRWSREHGYTAWCLAIDESLAKNLIKLGWKLKPLGKPAEYHNTKVVPMTIVLKNEDLIFSDF